MANFAEVYVTEQTAKEMRNRLDGDLKDWNPNAARPSPVRVEQITGGYEYTFGRDEKSRHMSKTTAYVNPGLRPGHIIINATETTIEAARNAGFDIPEVHSSKGFKKPTERSTVFGGGVQVGDFPTIQIGAQQETKAGTDGNSGEEDTEIGSDPEGRQPLLKWRVRPYRQSSVRMVRRSLMSVWKAWLIVAISQMPTSFPRA